MIRLWFKQGLKEPNSWGTLVYMYQNHINAFRSSSFLLIFTKYRHCNLLPISALMGKGGQTMRKVKKPVINWWELCVFFSLRITFSYIWWTYLDCCHFKRLNSKNLHWNYRFVECICLHNSVHWRGG